MNLNRMSTRPLDLPRTLRRHGVRNLTSMPAGRVVPLATIPLLREDAVRRGTLEFRFEMLETAEVLMNAINVRVMAFLVPWLAFERFGGSMDIFNRSYMGQPPMEGEAVIPFFETHALGAHGSKPLYKYMGLHGKSTDNVNTMYAETYNLIQNWRAAQRSPKIGKRDRLDTTLAPAFWRNSNFDHIVPDFDQGVMEGRVALTYSGGLPGTVPVRGIALKSTHSDWSGAGDTVRQADGTAVATVATAGQRWTASSSAAGMPVVKEKQIGGQSYPDIAADMTAFVSALAAEGFQISLANIDLARKTQAFARLREQYSEHDDEWLVDMLMSGLSIPDQALKHPMLLAESNNVFGMNKRFSTDADALTAAAVNGFSMARLNINIPRLSTGGIVMVVAEIVPDQLFERMEDPFFHTSTVASLPDALRDELDPQKVVVVPNRYVDTDHATPNGVFGYAPLGHQWSAVRHSVGGKFHRPTTNTVEDEDRQRIWASETVNPQLTQDFYLTTTLHQKPFLDTLADPFEAVTVGELTIEGQTVLGPLLVEAMNNYDAVAEKAPTDRIVKP